MILLPKQSKKWTQINNSDVLGDLWASFSLDVSRVVGKIMAGYRMIRSTTTRNVAEMTSFPVRFFKIGTHIYTIAGTNNVGYAFYNEGNIDDPFVKDVSAGAPTLLDSKRSAIIAGNNTLYVAAPRPGNTAFLQVYFKVGNLAWDTFNIDASISSGYPNTYTMAAASFIGRIYLVVEGSRIISWDTANSVAISGANTLTLDVSANTSKQITFLIPASDRLWIGTVNGNGGMGYIYEWDGQTTTFNKAYPIQAAGALSGVIYNDILHVIDSNGDELVWNGGGFINKTGLNRITDKELKNPTSLFNDRFIHPYGGMVHKDRIHWLINGVNNDGSIEETIPSGVYESSDDNGLIHKHPITLSSTTDPIIDYGQMILAGVGGISPVLVAATDPLENGSFLLGATFYTDNVTTESGVFYDDRNDTVQKALSLISSKLEASDPRGIQSIQNVFQTAYVLLRDFLDIDDKVQVKYRSKEIDPLIATITWTSTTTFTTTALIESYWESGIGGEVEVIQGIGSGKCAHITNVLFSSPTYTVTVDESFYGATGSSIARFQHWKKVGELAYGQDKTVLTAPIDKSANWAQIKLWGLFRGRDAIENIVVTNDNSRPVK